MALDFPNSPTNGQVYTDAATGEQWIYDASTNSWTSKGLVNTGGGLAYKGDVDITAAPPAGATSGSQYSVNPGGTANAGFGPGVTGTISKGSMVMYTGTGWIETSHAVPDATPLAKGIDTQKWSRTGTTLAPATAGDAVDIDFPLGTAALPGLTPVGDPNTGIYSPGADQLALSTGGTGRLFVDASGNVNVGISASTFYEGGGISIRQPGTATLRLDDSGSSVSEIKHVDARGLVLETISNRNIVFSTGAVERMRLSSAGVLTIGDGTTPAVSLDPGTTNKPLVRDSTGRLLVGTTSASSLAGLLPTIQTESTSLGGITSWNSANTKYGAFLALGKSRGTTTGSVDLVQDGDELGIIYFFGADGADRNSWGAEIKAVVSGTPGANDLPASLVFATTADGTATSAEQLRITPDRYVRLAAGTGGIQFGGDTAAANALDDYEEGTWTPTFFRGTTQATLTTAGSQSRYVKIGRQVTLYCGLNISLVTTQATGSNIVKGLPFVPAEATYSNNGSVGAFPVAVTAAQASTDGAIRFLDQALAAVDTNWAVGYVGFTVTYTV